MLTLRSLRLPGLELPLPVLGLKCILIKYVVNMLILQVVSASWVWEPFPRMRRVSSPLRTRGLGDSGRTARRGVRKPWQWESSDELPHGRMNVPHWKHCFGDN
ncbi:unnamed protein product [Effrenium voratum]|nr:unnamed protein product [Effrenium voratum]